MYYKSSMYIVVIFLLDGEKTFCHRTNREKLQFQATDKVQIGWAFSKKYFFPTYLIHQNA